jgi:HAD superfamily hydrolase (TIGR01450 family)
LAKARSAGITLAFVTNNAARPAAAVAAQLTELGVPAEPADVVTSAQAAARELVALVGRGAAVFVVGGEGLQEALRERDLVPVSRLEDEPAAVVQGFSPDVGWRLLAAASYVLATGVPWVASNLDLTVPTAQGIAPGNGSLVNAVAAATNRRPDVVAGKPYRPLFDETVDRVGAERPLVVGDRLDTDIEGASRCGAVSLLVMTGVTDLDALCAARGDQRPSYVARRLSGLLDEHHAPEPADDGWRLGGWVARVEGERVRVVERAEDPDDGLRVIAAAAWAWRDASDDSSSSTLDLSVARDALEIR